MLNRHQCLAWLIALLLLPGVTCRCAGQASAGTLRGVVTDEAGAPVPLARVTIFNLGTHRQLSLDTDAHGAFTLVNLPPGSYSLTSAHAGFKAIQLKMVLAAGEVETLRLRMEQGDPKTIVKQTTAEAQINTASSANGGVEDSTTVRDLPSNGRDWTQAATLQAGVSSVKTQPDAGNTSSGRGQRGFGAQISISGGRPQQNNYIMNGVSINDYANSAPGSVLGLNLGADAVEQFSVITSNYPADYGRSSGGVVDAVTRSGSNQFHGSVYEYLRNSALDARNYFDGAKPPFRRNQYGAALGGPVRKQRAFFFANYEALRQSLGITNVDTVPSPAARAGQLSTGNVSVDPEAARYLAFYPLPNRGLLPPGDTGIFAFSAQEITPENYFTARIDDRLRDADSLTGSYVYDSAQTTEPDLLNVRVNELTTQRNLLALNERHSFSPDLLNSFRFGLNRVVAQIGLTPSAISPLAADISYGFLPGRTAGLLTVLGLTNFSGGLGAASPYLFHWTSLQAYDDVSYTRGMHSLRFGAALERMRDNILASTSPNGSFVFHSLADFLTNQPFSLAVALTTNPTPRDLRQTLFAAYAQDDLRVNARLTVNLGLRYEMVTVPTEVAGRLSTLRNLTDVNPHLGNNYFSNPTRANFEPRLGFAWDVLGNGRVAIHSGLGIFDVLPLPYEFELISLFASPYFESATPSALPPGSFYQGAIGIAQGANTSRKVYVEPHPRRNYVAQWNLSLGLTPAKSTTFLLGYVGSRGIHQPVRVDDTNLVLPANTPQGYEWPEPIGSGVKLNPSAGRLDGLFWRGDSYYDALQVQAAAGPARGLAAQFSYTWGKSFDDGSATVAGDQFANSISSLPWYDLRLARGPSDFNIAQTVSLHLDYLFPSPGDRSRAWPLKGWRGIGTWQASTGAPFTPVIGGDPLGTLSTDPYDVPDRIESRNCSSGVNAGNPGDYLRLECFAFPNPANRLGDLHRNSITGPGAESLDVSLVKDTRIQRISNSFSVQARLEAFNVLNRANFLPPLDHRQIFDQTGAIVPGTGLIDATATPSRQMQVGLKIVF